MYDHGFQWGSKRTGPDLARVGNKYSDKWHVEHMKDPRSVVPASVMPGYPFLATTDLKIKYLDDHLKTNRMVGVPYTDDMIKNAVADAKAQAGDPDADEAEGVTARYGVEEKSWKVTIRDFDGNPERLTEMDALIAYLQVLGTMVDFSLYKDKAPTQWLR
jgi:cytochrome c oxidase cbb3-type subunit 2